MFPILAGNSASTGYNLTRSLRFRASASATLSRTPSVAATSNKTFTVSFWMKPSLLVPLSYIWLLDCAGQDFGFYLNASYTASFQLSAGSYYITTSQVFRDPASWYHMVLSIDTTQATAANRVKLYVNGSQVTAFSSATYPPQNTTFAWNQNAQVQYFGRNSANASILYDGYLAEIYNIDGQALTPSSFGSTNALTGVWQPARYTGTYGTNGFYLPFTDNSALTTSSNVGLGKDFSGNGNYWTTNNISITAGVTYDSMTDVPTLTSATAANFAVLNPLGNAVSAAVSSQITYANLGYSGSTSGGCSATMALPAGKYYFETTISAITGLFVGLATDARNLQSDYGTVNTNIYGWYINPTISLVNNGTSTTWTSNTVSTGTVVNLAIDASNLSSVKVWLGKANVWYDSSAGTTGDPSTGANPTLTITAGLNLYPNFGFYNGGTSTIYMNFGQRPFTYTPPTGFVALNTFNLPTSTIVKGNTVMDATLWTGTGATLSIVNAAAFKPDLVWSKARSAAISGLMYDSVRGATKYLQTNVTSAEGTGTDSLTAFNSNGFALGADTSTTGVNQNGTTYVGWQWQAGQGSSSSNTNGSITSTVSVNASAGFSVVTWTGTGANATVGHGLGVAPSLIIVKMRSSAGYNWVVYHASTGNTGVTYLNLTNAFYANVAYWNNTSPTSSVFSLGTALECNGSASTYVAYCWTPIAGFSAFGSYTGNGSTDGVFVYTGFRPKFVMIKSTSTGGWVMLDTSRDTYNIVGNYLYANSSAAEATASNVLDINSNGFKIRNTWTDINGSGTSYVYAAFAETPFKNSLAR